MELKISVSEAVELIKEIKAMPEKIFNYIESSLRESVGSFCRSANIEFTRCRPYRKNDAPYVESKNWSMVRCYTGWKRYDTEEELNILKRLLKLISTRSNLFMPQMKLIESIRINGRVKKKYEINTPLGIMATILITSFL